MTCEAGACRIIQHGLLHRGLLPLIPARGGMDERVAWLFQGWELHDEAPQQAGATGYGPANCI